MSEQLTQSPTAVINISPEYDDGIIKLQAEGAKILELARAKVIESNEDLESFTEDIAVLANFRRTLEDKRKSYTQPVNGHLKSINDTFKVIAAPFEEANTILRKKVLDYRTVQQVKIEAAEKANRLRMEAAEAEAEANGGEITESVNLITPADKVPDKVHTGIGSSGVAVIWKWREVDLAKVPLQYLMLDSAKITKQVKAGNRDIPGIEIYSEENLRITARR